ncbi:DUF6281 family protein [Streptomyces sp. NBC_00247]|uniref:DUF6281 family protein n=1 Tax=Streptomyces sp. NBC_00247 TaxID=2975689 RepID=UPI003FA7AA47
MRRHRRNGQDRGVPRQGRGAPGGTGTAYAVDGISPELAVGVGDTPETATFFAVHSDADDAEFPPEVRKPIDGS